MQSKLLVLTLALAGAVLATLQSAAALASEETNPAEAPIAAVDEQGEMNNIDVAKNDVEDGAKNDMDDGAKNDVEDMEDGAKNESGQHD